MLIDGNLKKILLHCEKAVPEEFEYLRHAIGRAAGIVDDYPILADLEVHVGPVKPKPVRRKAKPKAGA